MEGMPPLVTQQVLDPEALAAAIRNANFEPCQISVRPSPSRIARVMCETVCLDYATLGPAMLFSGAMPMDFYTLVFVTECPQKGRSFNFATEHTDGYMGFFPPGGMLDAYTPEGYANATLTVPSAVFLAAVERSFPEISGRILSHGGGMRIGVAEQARLRGLLRAVTEGMGSGLDKSTIAFMGWFGPCGLASIVLGLIYLEQEKDLPCEHVTRLAVMATVFLSILAHGLSAGPGIRMLARANPHPKPH